VLAFIGFLMAVLVVYAVAQEVMADLQCIGYASGISDAMLGIALLARGNSVGGKCRDGSATPHFTSGA
jgi:sodium/potassium/calcium exchanger 6